ncbi:MAG TPA: glycoside hydrolase family 95 protein [Polyangiaceae bacterium]
MTRHVLWYRSPAQRWVEALPVGNGRLGAMVFGGVESERWQLNEDTLWTGGPEDADNPEAFAALPEIRRLLFAGRYAEAQRLTDRTQIRKASTHGEFGSYTTLGDLIFQHDECLQGTPSEYRRELDLERAIVACSFVRGGARHERQTFASAPDQVLVIRLSSSTPASLSGLLALARPRAISRAVEDDTLELAGELEQREGVAGMSYLARARVLLPAGGSVSSAENGLRVQGADEVWIVVAASTDYRGGDPKERVAQRIQSASRLSHAKLYERHVEEHRALFCRVELELERTAASALPTDERLLAVARGGADPDLFALYFQLGRYLLLASSRPGTMAANLQGIWADGLVNPWSCDYHTNINVQMNYWLAETANLAECVEPLITLIERMREPGRRTAKIHYGARGWVVHTIHNPWGFTAPGENPLWGLFPMAAPWLCQHLWEHYAFGRDLEKLRQVWPCLLEVAEFCLDWLVEHPHTGKLVSGPANSPENSFVAPTGEPCSISMGPAMDQQIIWDHFTNVLDAAAALGEEDELLGRVRTARERLLLPRVGQDGRLLEWAEDFEEIEPHHRHVSHLFGLHPGRQITPSRTPEWACAARKTLEARGDSGTGWSRAWKICFWARLLDGDRALELARGLLRPVALHGTEFAADGPGVYPNLLCAHPPYQIDGNLGATAGIAEMLLQSHDGFVSLLPALPKEWHAGRVSGLRARGGFVIDLSWQEGTLSNALVHSQCGNSCVLRYGSKSMELTTAAGESYDVTAAFVRGLPST